MTTLEIVGWVLVSLFAFFVGGIFGDFMLAMVRLVRIGDAERIGFYGDDQFFLERCPQCGKENYAPAVATGQCAWCGWDEDSLKDREREANE